MNPFNIFSFVLLISILLVHQTYADARGQQSQNSCIRMCQFGHHPEFDGPCEECLKKCCEQIQDECSQWSIEKFKEKCDMFRNINLDSVPKEVKTTMEPDIVPRKKDEQENE